MFKNLTSQELEDLIDQGQGTEPIDYLIGSLTSFDSEILSFFLLEELDFTLLVKVYLCKMGIDRTVQEVGCDEAKRSWLD
jgi:hypothetical protein